MSKSSFDAKFVNPLLRKLDEEARKQVQRQKGQLLILADTEDLAAVIQMSLPGLSSGGLKKSDLKNALKAGQIKAAELQKRFISGNKRRYNAIVSKLPDIGLPHTIGTDMFIVSSFSRSIDAVKKAMLSSLVSAKVFTEEQSKDISKNLHKGHGARGTAVSQVQIARSVSGLDDEDKQLLLHNLAASVQRGDLTLIKHRELEKLVVASSQIVTKEGKLRADYVSVISFQVGKENIADATEEKALKAAFREFVKELTPTLANMEGSSTLKEKVERVIVQKFTKKKYIKVKSKALSADLSTSNKSTKKTKKKSTKIPLIKGVTKKSKRKTTDNTSSPNLGAILVILKQRLPAAVAKNMGSPRLNNRTGRFASSVEVTDISLTPQGYPSIGYTYMKGPYETFEPGNAQGSVDRDPRKLIDASIREIAAGLAMGRFYTRRV